MNSLEGIGLDPERIYKLIALKKINYVDGYKTNLKNIENEESKNNIFISKNIPRMNL